MDTRSEEENNNKLIKLKDMLIGWRTLKKNKSYFDWWEFKKRNDKEWMEREGLCILLTDEVVDLMLDKSEKDIWSMCHHLASSPPVSSLEVQCSLVRLFTSVSDRVGRKCWKGHRVICWVVRYMLKWKEWSDETIDCVVGYLVKVLECEDMEMVKWAILTGEKWWLKMKMRMSSDKRDRLRTALIRHSKHNDTLEGAMDRNWWDAERYQVGWCAKWFEENLLEDGVKETPWIKLSRDRFEARCNSDYTSPVRSPFTVKSNVYFYEVICVQNEELELGWSTRETRMELFKGIGKYSHSVWLHLGKQCFIQNYANCHPIPTPIHIGPLNVIGCLLDLDKRKFEFYFNGRSLKCPAPEHLSSQPYFATARLSPHQHCHFNFGQSPFKYPPPNIRFTTFDVQSGGDERKYRLVETKWWGGYWFAHTPVDNQVSLFFDDEIQDKFDREVLRVEGDIENDREIGEWKMGNGDDYEENCWRGVRYIQAIMEVMGKVGGVDRVDVMAQWVGIVIEDVIDKITIALLFELLYPYLQLICTKSNFTQHRSICIVLLHLIKCSRHHSYKFIEQIHYEVFTYLSRTLTSTPDQCTPWTQLFVLIALTDLQLSEPDKRKIEGCEKIGQMVDTWRNQFEGENVEQLIKLEQKQRIQYQLYFCSHNLVTSFTPNPTNINRTSSAALNLHDLTSHLILSPCHLSACSDWHWQSVRSVCQVRAHIYYFEVLLLTAGSMTIGWATKRTELNKITKIYQKGNQPLMVGFDEFSIGYDGYNRCIYHDNKTFQLENIPSWKAGDIVGCLIDISKKCFQFFHNGSPINFTSQCPIYFSTQPYHAFISLSQFQQIYLNYGQSPFSPSRPKYVDFCDFYSDKPEVQEIKTVVNFNNTNLKSNLIAIDANINQRDVTITDNASASIRSAQSTETVGNNISSVHTLSSANIEDVHSQERSRIECRLCCSSSTTKLVQFACCSTLTLCLDCLRVMNECPKCKKQTYAFQADEIQPNGPKHPCSVCTQPQVAFRYISCDHFYMCVCFCLFCIFLCQVTHLWKAYYLCE